MNYLKGFSQIKNDKKLMLTILTVLLILISSAELTICLTSKVDKNKNINSLLYETQSINSSLIDIKNNLCQNSEPKVLKNSEPYPLTKQQRDYIEQIVMGEMGGESYIGQMAVAQCILDMARHKSIDPIKAIKTSGYCKPQKDVTEKVKCAVSEVFDKGKRVTYSRLLYFYAPRIVDSRWHETQKYITTIDGVRFFDGWDK